MEKITIKKSKIHGRGVFARNEIKKGELIEISPVLIFSREQRKQLDKARLILFDYYFSWKENQGAFALGFGSLYNHSFKPNAIFLKDYKEKSITFKAIKDIRKGEEIFVNYNGNPSDKTKVRFEAK